MLSDCSTGRILLDAAKKDKSFKKKRSTEHDQEIFLIDSGLLDATRMLVLLMQQVLRSPAPETSVSPEV